MFGSEEAGSEVCDDSSAELLSCKQISLSIESTKIRRSQHLAIYGTHNSFAVDVGAGEDQTRTASLKHLANSGADILLRFTPQKYNFERFR